MASTFLALNINKVYHHGCLQRFLLLRYKIFSDLIHVALSNACDVITLKGIYLVNYHHFVHYTNYRTNGELFLIADVSS